MEPDDQSSKPDSKLDKFDAAFLIFLISALCLSTSVLYVWALGLGLRIDFMPYLEIKDYLQITASWLCPAMVIYAIFASLYYIFRPHWIMPERGWKLILIWVLWLFALLFAFVCFGLLPLPFVLSLFLCWLLNRANRGIKFPYWPIIFRSLPAIYTFAFLSGLIIGPFALHNFSNVSKIYLEGAGSQAVQGRILFGMTKNLMFLRQSDGVFIAVPSSKLQRIETLPRPLITTPALTPTPTTTPAPTPIPTAPKGQ